MAHCFRSRRSFHRPTRPTQVSMFRNQYDTDVTTFSPAGRLHQVSDNNNLSSQFPLIPCSLDLNSSIPSGGVCDGGREARQCLPGPALQNYGCHRCPETVLHTSCFPFFHRGALCTNEIVWLASHHRSRLSAPSDLGSYQKKVFKIDEHMGMAVSGLIADARLLGA